MKFKLFDGVDIGTKFEAFCWYHMKSHLKHPIGEFNRELISLIDLKRVGIAAPRSFAKSTYFSLFYALFVTLEYPVKVLLMSATGSLAEHWLMMIKTELETNRTLNDFYGDQVTGSKKWTTEEIHLANGSVIQAKGFGKQTRGFRPNIIIGDDLETNEMVVSVEQRKKFDHDLWTDVAGMLLEDSQFIIIGTILHPESALAEMMQYGRHGWETRFYQAIQKDGTPLWEDQWSLEQLYDKKKEIGDYEFAQEYMNDPVPDDLRVFKKDSIQYFDEEPQGCVYFTTVDPAIEVGNAFDYTAIVTCAVDVDENIYVVDVVNKQLLPKELIDKIFEVYKRYKSSAIGIEEMGFQRMLRMEIQQQRRSRKEYPKIVELKSGGRRKGLRIEGLQPRFESGRIFIKKDQTDLETQLLRFPSPRCKDDIIDALAYLIDIIRPAKEQVLRTNPESFIAEIERTRRKRSTVIWGNQNLRSKWH